LWGFLRLSDYRANCAGNSEDCRISVVGGPGIEPGTSAL
jgi:hypothetical protein